MRRTKLLVGMTVFWFGLALLMDGLNSIVLPMQLLDLDGTGRAATRLGLLTFVGLLVALVIQPMAGEWSDRMRGTWGRTGGIALALFGILAGLFALSFGQSLVTLFVAYLVIQIAASIGRASMVAFVPDMLPYDKSEHGNAVQAAMQAAGSALGFVVLGSFLAAAALSYALMVVGAVLTAAFLLTVLLVGESPRPHGVRHSSPTWDDLFRFDFRTHRRYGWLVLSRGLFLIGLFAVSRFLLLFLVDRFALDPTRAAEQSGLLLAAAVTIIVLLAPIATTLGERFGHAFVMPAGALLSATGIAVLAFSNSLAHVVAGVLLTAFGSGAFLASNAASAADLIPAMYASKFQGLGNLAVLAAAAVAGLFGPLLNLGARGGVGKGQLVMFAFVTAAFVVGALVARPGLAPASKLRERVPESSQS